MHSKYKPWDKFEYFLGLLALLGLFLLVHLNMSKELRDPDIWLHLKTGEYIVQHKSVPKIDIFSSTLSSKEWINHSWLVQVIFYLVFHFAGPDNLIFLSAILVIGAFLFLFLTVYEQRQQLTLNVALLFITILASRVRFNIRPENFSILFFSIYLFLLKRHIDKRWLFLLVLLQLIWVNCHGFFILGPLVVGVFILSEKAKKAGRLPWGWGQVEALDSHSYRNLLRLFWLLCAVCLVNPYGYKGALYPLKIIFSALGKSSMVYRYIVELLPPWQLTHQLIFSYYVLTAISLLAFLLNFRKTNLTWLMLWLIFAGLSFRINRNIIYFNFVAFITATEILTKAPNLKINNLIQNFFSKSIYLLRYAIIIIIILWTGRAGYSLLTSRYYIFEEGRIKSALLGIAVENYPERGANFIIEKGLPDNIFNLFNYGSYLIYRLSPEKKVFIDGRTELYTEDLFKNFQKIKNLDRETIKEVFSRYNINTILLSGDIHGMSNLARYFFNDPDWSVVFFDKDAIIFLRNAAQNKILIGKLKTDLEKWQTPKIDLDKIGMRDVFPEPYIKRAWMFYYLGLDAQAMNEVKEALKIKPSIASAYIIRGRIYTHQKLYPQAFENLRLARIYGPSLKQTLLGLAELYSQTGKLKEAIDTYKRLVKLDPYYSEGYYLLGLSYSRVDNLKAAVEALKSALKIDPFVADYYKELGNLWCKNNALEEARKVYKDALAWGLEPAYFAKQLENIK